MYELIAFHDLKKIFKIHHSFDRDRKGNRSVIDLFIAFVTKCHWHQFMQNVNLIRLVRATAELDGPWRTD